MLVVTVFGTTALVILSLLLCLLCAGLAMTAFVAYIAKSPAVQRALRFPGASGEMMSRCARLAAATLAFGMWFVAQSVSTGMFMAVEFLGPSSRPEDPTPPLSAAGSTTAVDTTAAGDTPLPFCSVEEPSTTRTDTT